MSAAIETEQELIEEAFSILRKYLAPHKVAGLASIWHVGKGDYLKEREVLFAGETVESLLEHAAAFQAK